MGKKRITDRIVIPVILISIVIVSAAGLHLKKHVKSGADDGAIRMSMPTSTTPNDWEIAEALSGRDVFKEAGFKPKYVPSIDTSGMNGMMVILSGKMDIASGGWVGWINVRARGGRIKAVLPGSIYHKDRKCGLLVLENSNIYSVRDLAGKTVAVNMLGLTGDYTLRLLLKKHGVPENKVQIIPVPSASQEQALRSKQIDAIADTLSGGSLFERTLDRGGIRLIPNTGNRDVQGDSAGTGTGFTEDFIKSHPDQVRRYVAAVIKMRDIILEYYQKDPEHVRKVYAEIAKKKDGNPALAKYYSPGFSSEHSTIRDSDVQWWIDLLVSEGKLKPGQIKPGDVYTNEFNPHYKESKS